MSITFDNTQPDTQYFFQFGDRIANYNGDEGDVLETSATRALIRYDNGEVVEIEQHDTSIKILERLEKSIETTSLHDEWKRLTQERDKLINARAALNSQIDALHQQIGRIRSLGKFEPANPRQLHL